MKNNKNILKKAAAVELLACDVDGVLTRGEIIILNSGEEVKIWNVKDGMGYSLLKEFCPQIKTAWITGRSCRQVKRRAADMKIDFLVQGCLDKKNILLKIAAETGLKLSQTAYIGDDIADIAALNAAGLSVCPQDACGIVKKSADYISAFNGGQGTVREVIEIILQAKGASEKILKKYDK
ncbi:MAG: HAD hydrolase family protein [Endomicrobium sp.]|jgi:3-deoxy-D-manno-octulosonate 8-phosphate phosphatase (KDO 8-P phosphatase)|nr:HAD hydrolase family protein [Endomicrobium sp.]